LAGKINVMITDRQLAVAGMLGRGYSQRYTAAALDVSKGTIVRWNRDPAFRAEVDRARASRLNPTPRGVLVDSLAARKDDGVDWNSRLRGALALLGLDDPDEPDDDEPGWV